MSNKSIASEDVPAASPPQALIWLHTAFLGDIIILTAAIAAAAKKWPGIEQHVITTKLGCLALSQHPQIKTCIAFDKTGRSSWKAFLETRRQVKSLKLVASGVYLLQAHRSFRSSILAASLGFPVICYENSMSAVFAFATCARLSVFHESSRLALLLEPLGLKREELSCLRAQLPRYAPQKEPSWHKDLRALKGKLIGIAPGSVWGTKRWPIEKFAMLAKELTKHGSIVLIGSAGEAALSAYIEEALAVQQPERLRLLNLCGKTSLDDLRMLVPKLDLLICNDSSPMHYASAFNIPTLALFGATVPAMGFGPLAEGSISLGVEGLACRPCSDHGPERCPLGHFRCMLELDVHAVLSASLKMLN